MHSTAFSLPQARKLFIMLIVMDKSMFPPKITVHKFEMPFIKHTAVTNRTNCISMQPGKMMKPST